MVALYVARAGMNPAPTRNNMTLQGKGFFLFQIPECEGGDPAAILAAAQTAGFSHVLVKIADGVKPFGIDPAGSDYTLRVVQALRGAGIAVWGWHYVYGNNPSAEADVAIRRTQTLGLDGYVVDAEQEYKQPGKAAAARQFMAAVRSALDNIPIALSSYRFPNYHPELPWAVFLEKCDLHMPQVYWEQAHNAGAQLRESKRQCDALPNARPYIPTGATYGTSVWNPTAVDVTDFLNTARDLGLPAANFFDWDFCRKSLPKLWAAIADFDWPAPSQLVPGVITPGTTLPPPPPEPDAFATSFLAALNSRQAEQIAILYAPVALRVCDTRLLTGATAIQQDYATFFAGLPGGDSFIMTHIEVADDVRYLAWKAGLLTGQTTLVLEDEKINLDFTFLA